MSDDVFGQMVVFMFIEVPTGDVLRPRGKKVNLATIHCRRSECDENFLEFKSLNGEIARKLHAEFSFRECV